MYSDVLLQFQILMVCRNILKLLVTSYVTNFTGSVVAVPDMKWITGLLMIDLCVCGYRHTEGRLTRMVSNKFLKLLARTGIWEWPGIGLNWISVEWIDTLSNPTLVVLKCSVIQISDWFGDSVYIKFQCTVVGL